MTIPSTYAMLLDCPIEFRPCKHWKMVRVMGVLLLGVRAQDSTPPSLFNNLMTISPDTQKKFADHGGVEIIRCDVGSTLSCGAPRSHMHGRTPTVVPERNAQSTLGGADN